MLHRDKAILWDIAHAAEEISEFVRDVTQKDFEQNRLVRYAVERQLMVIGEAANRLSDELKAASPDIPWRQIIGMRNLLAHEYGEIVAERVWLTAVQHVPTLLRTVSELISGSA